MKKILLALLCLILVLFPSCQEEIRNPETDKPVVVEPDYQNNPTTIALYVEGRECEPDDNGVYEMFLEPLSKAKTNDSVTITVKNTGNKPAKISMSHREYIINGNVVSELPEILNPGESANLSFSYSVLADHGLLPAYVIGNITLGGNFPARFINFRGTKLDVPIINIHADQDQGNFYGYIAGMEMKPFKNMKFNNYRATAFNQLVFQYYIQNDSLLYSKLDSIEVTGKDSEYFNVVDISERFFSADFNPIDSRLYEVTLELHILSSDFKECIREVPLTIDVISIDKGYFVNNELHLNEFDCTRIYNIVPRSNGHAYIYAIQGDMEGVIEIDENDEYVDWHGTTISNGNGYPVDGWVDEVNDAVIIIRAQGNDYCLEVLDVISKERPKSIYQHKLEFFSGYEDMYQQEPELAYLGQSPDFLIFQFAEGYQLFDKHDYMMLPPFSGEQVPKPEVVELKVGLTYVQDMIFEKVIYDKESNAYIFATAFDIIAAQYDQAFGFKCIKEFDLGNKFKGTIKDFVLAPDGFYVMNDSNAVYAVKISDLGFIVEFLVELDEYKTDRIYYANNHLYFMDSSIENMILSYDIDAKRVIPICELIEPYNSRDQYYLLVRNGNLYYSTSIYSGGFTGCQRQGYIRRIPLI